MGTDPVIKQDEPSNNVNFGADNPQDNSGHHSGGTAQPIPILGQNPAQQSPQMAASHEQPYSMWRRVKSAATSTDDYFEHDNKVYQKKDGKTFLVTGAPEGDVELDADQTAKLDQARADKAEKEKADKGGPILTDQVPGGVIDPNDPQYASPTNPGDPGKRADTPFNQLPPGARAALVGATAKHLTKPFLGKIPGAGEYLADGVGIAAGAIYNHFDSQTPELDRQKSK